MPTIRLIDHHTVYDNPVPNLRSRHAYFPDLVALPSGELLALFMLGEAMEATDGTTMVSRSADGGRTWELQGPLHERPANGAGPTHSDYQGDPAGRRPAEVAAATISTAAAGTSR